MSKSTEIQRLEERKKQILDQLLNIGDFRPGQLYSFYRKCGSIKCACASDREKRHGPHWMVACTMNGKRTSRGVPARALEQAREQLLRYRRFKTLSADLTEVSAKICHIKIQSAEPAGKEAEEKTVDSESLPN